MSKAPPDIRDLPAGAAPAGTPVLGGPGGTGGVQDGPASPPAAPGAAPGKNLTAAAVRALLEAAERRSGREAEAAAGESGGPKGLEPTRYGDWERKGVAIDF